MTTPILLLLHHPIRRVKPNFFTTPSATRRLFSSRPPSPPPKVPKKLKHYAALFAGKPVSYFTSFIILHEITAIVPVVGLFWYIHSTEWTPPGVSRELVERKMEWAAGWTREWGMGEWFQGRALLELGTAYAVVKILMPVRMALSIAAAPWFARLVVEPGRRWAADFVKRVVGRKK